MHVKGLALVACKNFLEKRYNQPEIEKFKEALGEKTAYIYDNIMPNKFYLIEYFIKINKTIVDVFNNGDISVLKRLGRFSADEAVRGIYRAFFKFGTPQFIIKQAANVFSKYYDQGKMSVIDTTSHSVTSELTGFGEFKNINHIKYVCFTIEGWIERALEICAGKTSKTEHVKCTSNGDGSCVFVCKWGN